jgi:hypothetical protein
MLDRMRNYTKSHLAAMPLWATIVALATLTAGCGREAPKPDSPKPTPPAQATAKPVPPGEAPKPSPTADDPATATATIAPAPMPTVAPPAPSPTPAPPAPATTSTVAAVATPAAATPAIAALVPQRDMVRVGVDRSFGSLGAAIDAVGRSETAPVGATGPTDADREIQRIRRSLTMSTSIRKEKKDQGERLLNDIQQSLKDAQSGESPEARQEALARARDALAVLQTLSQDMDFGK